MATQVKSLNTTKLDSKLDVNGLTDVDLKGKGVLDKFLQLQRLVLDREFNDGRLHGKEYADSFIATYTINMELAIKFLLEKEKQFYEIENLEAQKKQFDLQNELLTHQIEEQEYKNKNHLPLETMGLSLRNDNLESDIALKESQIANSKKDLELKEYELTNIKPQELALKTAQVDAMLKDIEIKDYELKFIKPQELAIKASQLAIAEKELLIKAKQLELAEYELLHKLPAEVEGIVANNDLVSQKKITEKAQTDATAYGPDSVIDWNIKTLEAQIAGIEQDSKQKIMRMLISTWETRLNNDGVDNPSEAGLGDIDIKQAVDAAKASVGIL